MSFSQLSRALNISISIVLAIVGLLVLYFSLPLFGHKAMIVRSGSMEPTLPVGSVIVLKENDQLSSSRPFSSAESKQSLFAPYKIGDVITFNSDEKKYVTHRIVATEFVGRDILYVTKGDANQEADEDRVKTTEVVGSRLFHIPEVGKLFTLAKTKDGFYWLIIFPAIAVIFIELINITREIIKQRKRHKPISFVSAVQATLPPQFMAVTAHPESKPSTQWRRPSSKLAAVVILLVSSALTGTVWAFFSDTASSTGNVFTAAILSGAPTPTPSTGTPTPTPTPDGVDITFDSSSDTIAPDENVTLDVVVDPRFERAICAELSLIFDPTKFQFVSFTAGPSMGLELPPPGGATPAPTLHVVDVCVPVTNPAMTTPGIVGTFTFKALSTIVNDTSGNFDLKIGSPNESYITAFGVSSDPDRIRTVTPITINIETILDD